MKRIILFSVELRNTTDFTFNPGAERFIEEFKDAQSDFFYFHFDLDRDSWKEAEKTLTELRLAYSTYYRIELEDDEIKEYPVLNLVIPSLYDLIVVQANDNFKVNGNELAGMPIAEDFESGLLVAEKKVIEIFQSLSVPLDIRFKEPILIKKREYIVLNSPKVMEIPMIVLKADDIREDSNDSATTYYPDGIDERFDLSPEGIEYVNTYHFVSSRFFQYKGKLYKKNAPNFLVSGQLAFALRNVYKQHIQFSPLTLKYI